MDAFVEVLRRNGGVVSDELMKARGRYLDAMVDGHKYCAKARAAIFGEPDFVTATVRLCCENGIVPVIAATGSVCPTLKESVKSELDVCADISFVENTAILDDCDFDTIERYCVEFGVNVLIGSSDGRRIARKLDIPLIRCAFPIHDHVGGQRVRTLGFDGSLNILDRVANAMLDKTEASFRGDLFNKYYKDNGKPIQRDERNKTAEQCRSDAAGTPDEDISQSLREVPVVLSLGEYKRFAVATKSGSVVDMHFGHAEEFYIYESNGADTRFIETRNVNKYCSGVEDCDDKSDRWASVIRAVEDCKAVLALRIGQTPAQRLKDGGIGVISTYERVEDAVALAARDYQQKL
jgi:predicted Fe-Mo cluster-binding NifX family protein